MRCREGKKESEGFVNKQQTGFEKKIRLSGTFYWALLLNLLNPAYRFGFFPTPL
jgi:hypothetical protein